jgi:uncharacterized protein YbjT (DUF2867 family)
MAESDDPAAAAARLEAALERIARLTGRPPGPPPELAQRLDALIVQIRRLLARHEE